METKQLPGASPDLVEVLCGEVAAECICNADAQHDGPHVCDCGGSWAGVLGGNDFRIVNFPGSAR